MGFKKKDTVVVISGDERGKRGEILKIFSDKNKAIVAKVNLVKKHVRASREKPGGIQTIEAPLPMAKLQFVCPKCNQAVRLLVQRLEDGSRVRTCRKCREQIL
ncbi:MAG: 50S ribosomal protein L24 [Elusimicrobia bacterium]|nr:50S ribosomal protein L24 [Elusimicrobiota bacterium]